MSELPLPAPSRLPRRAYMSALYVSLVVMAISVVVGVFFPAALSGSSLIAAVAVLSAALVFLGLESAVLVAVIRSSRPRPRLYWAGAVLASLVSVAFIAEIAIRIVANSVG